MPSCLGAAEPSALAGSRATLELRRRPSDGGDETAAFVGVLATALMSSAKKEAWRRSEAALDASRNTRQNSDTLGDDGILNFDQDIASSDWALCPVVSANDSSQRSSPTPSL